MLGLKLHEKEVCGEHVYIRNLNGSAAAIRIIELTGKADGNPDVMAELGALLVVCCLCDSSGKQLYTDADSVRNSASFKFLSEFALAALEVTGLTDESDLVKNSEAGQ